MATFLFVLSFLRNKEIVIDEMKIEGVLFAFPERWAEANRSTSSKCVFPPKIFITFACRIQGNVNRWSTLPRWTTGTPVSRGKKVLFTIFSFISNPETKWRGKGEMWMWCDEIYVCTRFSNGLLGVILFTVVGRAKWGIGWANWSLMDVPMEECFHERMRK